MALPPYFDKAALAAASLMSGEAAAGFRHRVEDLSVAIAFGPDVSESPEGRVILDMLTNLLARFYPKLRFCSSEAAAELVANLQKQATRINPHIEFIEEATAASIVVGQTAGTYEGFTVFLGSHGWIARISTTGAQPVGHSHNPFGAGAVACMGVAFVFRHFFHEALGVPAPRQTFALSLASYEVTENVEDSHIDHPGIEIDLGEVALVGVGAIGCATVWALGATPCSGVLHLIDPETIDDTNPQRYVLADAESREKKVDLAMKYLSSSKLSPVAHDRTWAGFASARGFSLPRIAAVALDTALGRCAVQASLPEFVLNAWTQRGDLGISRHEFLGNAACLACLYWPRTMGKNLDELVMQAIRYSGPLMDVRNALYLRTPLDDPWLDRIAADMGVPRTAVEAFRNKTLHQFYQEAVCGGHVMPSEKGSVEVPMAFQSALAGIMLAGEIVKTARNPRIENGVVTTKIDLLRPIGTRLSEPTLKPMSIRCICRDQSYIKRYEEKHPHRGMGSTAPQ